MRTAATSASVKWTVSVTGQSARGLLRDCTSYRTEAGRDDAEAAGMAEAIRRWPASTKPIKVSSYASVHTVRADQDWKEICRWQERELNGEAEIETRPRCPHCELLLDKNGRCWSCKKPPEEWEKEMELVKDQPSTEALESEELAQAETATWCGKANGECTDGGACLDPDREGAICYDDCESFMAKEWFIAKGDGSGEALPECTVSGDLFGVTIPETPTEELPGYMAGAMREGREVDAETGEVFAQPTLSDEIFPATRRAAVPMVKIGFSGSVEMTEREFREYCERGLEPGRIVTITMTGFLPDPHSAWVKRSAGKGEDKEFWWEQEGRIKIKALELGSFDMGGIYRDTE